VTEPASLQIAVLTVSDTRGPENDSSGDSVAERLVQAGHRIFARHIVRDEIEAIRDQFRLWIADPAVDVVISTGGTGLAARDVTPEALAPLKTREIPGFGELFRMLSFRAIGSSTLQSRAEAAICDETPVFVLPGSPSAVALAMDEIVLAQLDSRHRPCNLAQLLPRLRSRGVQ
jgi:molybdenum cofactor biosynthesis protein B